MKTLRLFVSLIGLMASANCLANESSLAAHIRPAIATAPNASPPLSQPRLAIIIDDLGNSLTSGLKAIALPGNITFAVMPHRKYSKQLAERAGRLGKSVMLHAPMSTVNGRELGPGALDATMNETEFKTRLRFAILSTPYVKGLNNHMGSGLTTNPKAMGWVMDIAKEQQLFFIDSRTNANSVAFKSAQQAGIKSATRDIFLDHLQDIDHIHQQFKKAIAIAKRYGSAIVIGHPHPQTLYYLEHALPQLAHNQVQLHSITEVLKNGVAHRPDSARESRPFESQSLDQLISSLKPATNL